MRGWPKTSGSRGMHVNVRIEQKWTFSEVRRAALALSREIERRAPAPALGHGRASRITRSTAGFCRGRAKGHSSEHEQAPAPNAVSERAHCDEPARNHEPVYVQDPQHLRAARVQLFRESGDGEVEDCEVHGIDHARQCNHCQPDPLPSPRFLRVDYSARVKRRTVHGRI